MAHAPYSRVALLPALSLLEDEQYVFTLQLRDRYLSLEPCMLNMCYFCSGCRRGGCYRCSGESGAGCRNHLSLTVFPRFRFGQLSQLASRRLAATSQPVPQVLIGGGAPSLSVPSDQPLRLHGVALLSSCYPPEQIGNTTMRFEWVISGIRHVPRWERTSPFDPTLTPQLYSDADEAGWSSTPEGGWGAAVPLGWDQIIRTSRVLHLPALSLVAGENYTLTFAAYVDSYPQTGDGGQSDRFNAAATSVLVASADVQLAVRQASRHVRISGGDRLIHRGEPVVLLADVDGLDQTDGWRYHWHCSPAPCAVAGSDLEQSLLSGGFGQLSYPSAASFTFASADLLQSKIAPTTLSNFSFTFTAEFVGDRGDRGERVQATSEIELSSSELNTASIRFPPEEQQRLRIRASPTALSTGRHNPNERVVLEARLAHPNGTDVGGVVGMVGSMMLEWSSDSPVEGKLTGWRGGALILPAHSLGGGGGIYTFWLHVRHPASSVAVAGASLTVTLNEPPQHNELGGSALDVMPRSGEAFSTDFNLRAAGWTDLPDDLPLSFRFEVSYRKRLSDTKLYSTATAPLADTGLSHTLISLVPPGAVALRVVVSDVHGCSGVPARVPITVRVSSTWVDAAAHSTRAVEEMRRAIAIGDVDRALVLSHAIGVSIAEFAFSDPMVSRLHPLVWYRTELLTAEVLGTPLSDVLAASLPLPERALDGAADGEDVTGVVPDVMRREEWAAWRHTVHVTLRAQLIASFGVVAPLCRSSATLLLMHALSLETSLDTPSELNAMHEVLELGLAHAQWLLSESKSLGLSFELQVICTLVRLAPSARPPHAYLPAHPCPNRNPQHGRTCARVLPQSGKHMHR